MKLTNGSIEKGKKKKKYVGRKSGVREGVEERCHQRG